MKKKIVALIIAAAMAVSMMASCSVTVGSSKDDTSSADDTSSIGTTSNDDVSSDDDTSSEEASSSEPINVEDIDIADNWNSWQIAVEGEVYTVPCDVSEFEKNGWELGNTDGTLKANQYTLGQNMKKGDLRISVQVINMSDNEIAMTDGQVGCVKATLDYNVSVVLPGGLVFDKNLTAEDVKAKYGEPDDITESENSVVLTYDGGYYKEVEFCFYNEESGMSEYSYALVQNFNVE